MRTRLGERTIIAVPNMANDKIVATLDGNFVKWLMLKILQQSDVQKLDYKIKVLESSR
jgi:hypothetical protein